jgi:hypothetical protein
VPGTKGKRLRQGIALRLLLSLSKGQPERCWRWLRKLANQDFYLIGGYLENRWGDLLGFCILTSIGLGCFTGGLQHFPDPPERSSWVMPRGFSLSSAATYFLEARGRTPLRVLASYAGVAGTTTMTTRWR